MEKMLKALLVLLIAILSAVMAFCATVFVIGNANREPAQIPENTQAQIQTLPTETQPAPTETEAPTEPAEERFLLTFVGDCTLGCRDAHAYADVGFLKTVGDDYGYPFRNVLKYFEEDELTMINLEGVFSEEGYAVQKAHTFRGPTSYVNILTENSVEAVTLANNHTMDYGQTGYDSTKAVLDKAGIPYVERDSSTVITTKNGLKIGVYGAVYYKMDTNQITEAIRQLRTEADIVVFAPHWGFEMNPQFNKEQEALAHAVIDAGADIVYGSHPHVLQAMEEYNNGVIFYSLGNFSFGGNNYPEDYDSALIRQEVIRTADGTVTLGETTVVPVSVSSISDRNNFQPTPYEEGSEDYVRVLEKLDLA